MTATDAPEFQELERLFALGVDEPSESGTEPTIEPAQPPHSLADSTESPEPVSAEPAEPLNYRLEDLPKELGVLLTSVGIMGLILPGIAGTPALIAGGLVLWPRTFGRVETWFESRFPSSHRSSMKQVGRFLGDLERRYPLTTKP